MCALQSYHKQTTRTTYLNGLRINFCISISCKALNSENEIQNEQDQKWSVDAIDKRMSGCQDVRMLGYQDVKMLSCCQDVELMDFLEMVT